MKSAKVIILGGGPSALFSFYGALDAGYDWTQVQVRAGKKTYPPGAFWLHKLPKPRATPDRITIKLKGTPAQYSINQWGEEYPTSAGKYQIPEVEQAFNPHFWIPELWKVVNYAHDPKPYTQDRIEKLAENVDYVIQTFSTDSDVLRIMQLWQFPVYTSTYTLDLPNECIYNGERREHPLHWNRCTQAFGIASVEYTREFPKNLEKNVLREAELRNGLSGKGSFDMVPDIHPTQEPIADRLVGKRKNILLTGRWTTLDRKALSHDSQEQVRAFLRERIKG